MSEDGKRSWLERISRALTTSEPSNREELVGFLKSAESSGLLPRDSLPIIEGAIQMFEMRVRDIMVPRAEMVVIERDAEPDDLLSVMARSGHSRFPVVGESRDDVIGILLAKDLIPYLRPNSDERLNIRDLMRPVVRVPESKRLNAMLREFRSSRNHMAIVVDEYNGVSGVITIEDVLEQIVGEIDDEHDVEDEEGDIRRNGPTRFNVKARTPIDAFNEYFGTEFPEDEFDTVGGLVTQQLGHVPRRGESVSLDAFQFKVLRSDSRRAHLFRVLAPRIID